NVSVIGINRESIPIGEPDYAVVEEKRQLIITAAKQLLIARLYPTLDTGFASACIKQDIAKISSTGNYSLQPQYGMGAPGYAYAVPGKMTEAPFLADKLVAI